MKPTQNKIPTERRGSPLSWRQKENSPNLVYFSWQTLCSNWWKPI